MFYGVLEVIDSEILHFSTSRKRVALAYQMRFYLIIRVQTKAYHGRTEQRPSCFARFYLSRFQTSIPNPVRSIARYPCTSTPKHVNTT